jgi:hypothetical protein
MDPQPSEPKIDPDASPVAEITDEELRARVKALLHMLVLRHVTAEKLSWAIMQARQHLEGRENSTGLADGLDVVAELALAELLRPLDHPQPDEGIFSAPEGAPTPEEGGR